MECKGFFFTDYCQTGKTINSEYYYNFLDQLDGEICDKRPASKNKNILHQNNAPAHTAQKAIR